MIRICGDVNLTDGYFDVGFGLGTMVKNGKNPLAAIEKNNDYWVGNFEGVASSHSKLTGVASSQFRILPSDLGNVLNCFNAMGLANNHVMQHGDEAYLETAQSLEQLGIKTFGSKDKKSLIFEHEGKKFSLTGFSQRIDQFSEQPLYWHNPDFTNILEEVNSLPSEVFKIVYVHWGYEYINRPSQYQKLLAHYLIDIGYDLVVGMHPHVLQGYEIYKTKYIFYSLGNFSFDMPWMPTKYGAIVNVDSRDKSVNVSFDYVHIKNDLTTEIVDESEVPESQRFSKLNKYIERSDNGESYFNEVNSFYRQYRKANHRDIISKMIRHPKSIIYITRDFIRRRLIKKL